VGFLERDFERDHLAEKSNRTKMGQKIHCAGAELHGNRPHIMLSDLLTQKFVNKFFLNEHVDSVKPNRQIDSAVVPSARPPIPTFFKT
jgi:hypothetical protein